MIFMISVIIPVYNDPDGIQTTLESLSQLHPPEAEFEIIVSDNGSDDGTKEVVETYREENPKVKLVVEDRFQSSYAARNRGIREAEGDLLAFVDADMSVESTWFRELEMSMIDHDPPYVGQSVEVVVEEGAETTVAEYVRRRGFPVKRFMKNDHYAPTCCVAVRREVFDAVGLFDPRMISGGDLEFGQRVHDSKFEQRYESDITMYHPARSSLRSLCSKMFRVGRGLVQYNRYSLDRFDKPIWRDLRSYLPPHPLHFYRSITDTECESTPIKLLAFYILGYCVKLSRVSGAGYETLIGR
jgi:glycosyltransferase involved in cell wall biosynthesis